jgi:hypothetical protein
MQRYNVFETAHLAMQDALFLAAKSLRPSAGYSNECLEKRPAVIASLQASAQLIAFSETTILPAVALFEPAIADAIVQLHAKVVTGLQNVEALLSAPVNERVVVVFNQYLVAQLQVLIKSEEMLNPVLWYYYTDKELQEMGMHLLQTYLLTTEQCAA